MSQPFSGSPDPGFRRNRRFEPGIVQEALRSAKRELQSAAHSAKRHGQNLWQRGKRRPRTFGLIGGAVALTLAGAYTVSATGTGRSKCPSAASSSKKPAEFLVLMDRVPPATAGSEMEIHYDVCGLADGTAYSGKVRLLAPQTPTKKKKKAAPPKPLAVASFKDEVDGPATRRLQELELGAVKPGSYTIELLVVDNKGRVRKRTQKIRVQTD